MPKHDIDNRCPITRQYSSPLARDLESCAANLAALAGNEKGGEPFEVVPNPKWWR